MIVAITGGTGFVGSEVVRQLHATGHVPRLLVRSPSSSKAQELKANFDAELKFGDVLSSDSLAEAIAGCGAVIHLVGIISEVGRQTFARVHTEGACNVLSASKQAGVRRYIHMSALGTRPNAVARYHQTKWAAEQAVRASGLVWTVFRPSIIYGPGDGFVNLFARLSRFLPVLPLIGGGQTRFQPVSVADVASCFVGALTETASQSQTFDLTGPETLTLREIVETILAVTHRRRALLPLPFSVAHIQAACAEFVFNRCFRIAPPLNRDQVAMLREDNIGDGRQARELFRLSPTSFRDGISRYLNTAT